MKNQVKAIACRGDDIVINDSVCEYGYPDKDRISIVINSKLAGGMFNKEQATILRDRLNEFIERE